MTDNRKRMFYAYASSPGFIGEGIESFAKEINKSSECLVQTWTGMEISGLSITPVILDDIDRADIFAADLTTFNMNVFFELGYAIARQKIIWLTINKEIEDATKQYTDFRLMTNIAYFGYSNHHDLIKEFYEKQIYGEGKISLSQQHALFRDKDYVDVFALKAPSRLEGFNIPIEIIRGEKLRSIIDDYEEVTFYTLDWYCKNIYSSEGCLIQFMSDILSNRTNHNMKAALLAGICHGLKKQYLFLAQKPFAIPSDMPNLITSFDLAKQSKEISRRWINMIRSLKDQRNDREKAYRDVGEKLSKLGAVRLGEIVAEDESHKLMEYFVENSAYNEIINGSHNIFVGRKGTGKSANLVAVQNHFASESNNLVVLFNPVGYEVESLLKTLSSIPDAGKRGFLIDSLWRYLIYTEIAESVSRRYRANPDLSYPYYMAELMTFIERNSYVTSDYFSERINSVVDKINSAFSEQPEKDIREIVSSILQSNIVASLKKALVPVLEKYSNLVILVDNLDKGWTAESDTRSLADVLFGLMSVSKHLPNEIMRDVKTKFSFHVRMTIFIRSDIYTIMQEHAREKDKLIVKKIEWNDNEKLGRILDKRITYSTGIESPADAWREYFETERDGEDIKEFVIINVRPRPRDLIFLMNAAIDDAFDRGHPKVTRRDLMDAMALYSKWAYDSILEEDDPNRNKLVKIVDKFIDDKYIYNFSDVLRIIGEVVESQQDKDYYFSLLCDVHFLEIELEEDEFFIIEDKDIRSNKLKIANIRAQKSSREIRFRINRPFRVHLGIDRISRY